MKKACLVVNEYLQKNKIFDATLHRDNFVDRFVKLKESLESLGYDLSTQDVNSTSESDFVIYASNMPQRLPPQEEVYKSYLILSESAFIRPDNYDLHKHAYFNKVFTWHDRLVDHDKYIKLNYAHAFPDYINKDLKNKKKLCVLIAGNKKSKADLDVELKRLDLYSERENAIRWFEANALKDFDLYGVGWDKYQFTGPRIVRAMNRMPLLPKLLQYTLGRTYPSYKGTVEHKKPIMEQYKFSICYENAKDIPGYITEKIFDSFFSGCVPIYLGANNVSSYIPKGTFIDRREFSNYRELYDYLVAMPDSEYLQYLENIEKYLNSVESHPFRSESFVKTIIDNILN